MDDSRQDGLRGALNDSCQYGWSALDDSCQYGWSALNDSCQYGWSALNDARKIVGLRLSKVRTTAEGNDCRGNDPSFDHGD